jgi:predicted phosphodiesterase
MQDFMHLFIGDIHEKWKSLEQFFNSTEARRLYQVGDLGLGFPDQNGDPFTREFPSNMKFIRGNHDNPDICRKHPNYLGEYGQDEYGIFYISGGYSIDKDRRILGFNYWNDEELSYKQMNECLELYAKLKPSVVLSHECPASVVSQLFEGKYYTEFRDNTEKFLDELFQIHQPDNWIFGHYHFYKQFQIKKTKFHCVHQEGAILLKFPY